MHKQFFTMQDILNTIAEQQNSGILADNHAHVNLHPQPFEVIKNFYKHNGRFIIDVSTNAKELQISQKIYNQAQTSMPELKMHIANAIHPEYLHKLGIDFYKERISTELAYAISKTLETLNSQYIIDYATTLLEQNLNSISIIGEFGLDIYRLRQEDILQALRLQQDLFLAYLQLASKHNLPIMLHIRGHKNEDHSLYLQALKLIKQFENQHSLPAVYFHSFTGTWEVAKPIVDAGYFIGINGIATYSSAKYLVEVIKNTPAKQILPETDAPFLIPNRAKTKMFIDKKLNEPLGVQYIIEMINFVFPSP